MDLETVTISKVEYDHLLQERKMLKHELKLAWDYIHHYGNFDKRCPNCRYDSSVELEK